MPWHFEETFHAAGKGLIYGYGYQRVHYRADIESLPFKDTSFAIDPCNSTISDKVLQQHGDNPGVIARFVAADRSAQQGILEKLAVPDDLTKKARKQRPDLNWRPYLAISRDNRKFDMAEIYREAAEKYGQGTCFQFTEDGTPHLLWKREASWVWKWRQGKQRRSISCWMASTCARSRRKPGRRAMRSLLPNCATPTGTETGSKAGSIFTATRSGCAPPGMPTRSFGTMA